MILTQSQLIAEGFTLDPSARFGIRRKGNAVGSVQHKRPICVTYAGQCTPVADVIYTLAVGDIPEGHKVAFIDAKALMKAPMLSITLPF
ncbi:hypothetical protein [Pseudescherichia vulneris]|uniref:hypothetical protein n=1 Tax=Pseudescherichia vulneris TaxID=566 RepID=UPI0028D07012|nr:hypothetical protein [Pseudescherichia vulneris]